MKVSPSLAAVVVAGIVAASVVADEPEKIGQVRFAVSCRADVQKPFESDEILVIVDRAIEHQKLVSENAAFRANAEATPPKVLIGDSEPMQAVRERIKQVAASSSATVLISGESGTGKENVAQIIHSNSARGIGE